MAFLTADAEAGGSEVALKEAQEVTVITDSPSSTPRQIHGLAWALVVAAIISNIGVYALDGTIVAVIQPASLLPSTGIDIVRAFGQIQSLPWVSVGFMMAGTATALPVGSLYGTFDAKWLFISFSCIFLVGSALCGAAPNMTAMILGRVIAGLGGNGMYLGALTLLSVFTNPRETPAYIGYLGLMWGLGTVIGPIIGGAFAISRATWRWGFYINLVIGGLSFPVYFFALPSFKPQPTTKVMAELRRIDWIGAVLVMSAFVAGVMAISFGGTLYTWDSGQIIALFVVSGVLFIALALQQVLHILTTKTSRILPVHFFAQKDMFLLFVVQASVAAVVVIPVYYIPLFFQFAQGDSAIRAGVKILPLIITLVTLIVINGHMMGRFRFYQPWYLVGSILYMLAAIFLSRMTRSTSNSVIYGLEVLLGIGTGCYSQASFAVAQKLVDPSEIHNAISFILIAQLGGTTIGLCLAGAIFQNEAFNHLRALLPRVPVDSLRATITGTGSAVFEAAPPPLRVEILDIIVTAIGHTMILVYVAGALCLVCACFLTPKRI